MINLLDTPGHADFSEDTYRVLAAVDAAVMLLDAAKGLEPQTLKLFEVCRHRGIPVSPSSTSGTGPGRDAARAARRDRASASACSPTPLTWPVGIAGDFRGVLDRARPATIIRFTRTAGGATIAPEETLDRRAPRPSARATPGRTAVEESRAARRRSAPTHDQELFLAGEHDAGALRLGAAPTSACGRCSTPLVDLAPPPGAAARRRRASRAPLDAPFSAFVFKVQASMDTAHRDRLAFVAGLLGRLRARHGRHPRAHRPAVRHQVRPARCSAGSATTLDEAYPGDVVGLVNATALRVGDTLYVDEPVEFPPIPSFAPEHFAVAACRDTGRYKQFRKGIDQLDAEGVVQVLALRPARRPGPGARRGRPDAVRGGHRTGMEHEFGAPIELDRLPYTLARRTDEASAPELATASAASRCSRGPTASCWRCSATSGACACSRRTTRS